MNLPLLGHAAPAGGLREPVERAGYERALGRLGAYASVAAEFEVTREEVCHYPSRLKAGRVPLAPPDVLVKAIEELERKPAPAPADEDEARAVERAALRRAQTLLDEHLERHPALAEASPSVFIRDGVAQLRLGSSIELRAETLSAVTRFVVALDEAFRRG